MSQCAKWTLPSAQILLLMLSATSLVTGACGRMDTVADASSVGEAAVSFPEPGEEAGEDPVRIPDPVGEAAPVQPINPTPIQPANPAPQNPETSSTALAPNPQNAAMKDFERRVIELTNAERQKRGLSILTVNAHLLNNCRQWARSMASRRSLIHSNMDFGGENIAWNQSSPEEVVTSWMNSPGHRANILRTGFRSIGVSMVSSNGPYWCQQFGW